MTYLEQCIFQNMSHICIQYIDNLENYRKFQSSGECVNNVPEISQKSDTRKKTYSKR